MNCSEQEKKNSCIWVGKYKNKVILICHQNYLHCVDAKMNLQYFVIHNIWYPWGFLHVHVINLMKRASFWNNYISASEANTLNKMEIRVASFTQVIVKYFWHDQLWEKCTNQTEKNLPNHWDYLSLIWQNRQQGKCQNTDSLHLNISALCHL